MNISTTLYCKAIFGLLLFSSLLSHAQPSGTKKPKNDLAIIIDSSLQQSVRQYRQLIKQLPRDRLPVSFAKDQLLTSGIHAWTSGFYPGTLLFLYQHSKDSLLYQEAINKLKLLEKLQHVTTTHDLGFMMYCSFGNANRVQVSKEAQDILVQSARSLASRFSDKVGCIKSWNNVRSHDKITVWTYPVIIDNMMNLELLFYAFKVTGDSLFRNIAVKHAQTTLKNHLRPDYSSYHVVSYDAQSGAVKSRETHQGFADNSTWARGQAWGIYGFTMMYRETGDRRFLLAAQGMANFFLDHKNLPEDGIPYWDFNVNEPGYTPRWDYDPSKYTQVPRDASAAAITSSALLELTGYCSSRDSRKYLKAAETMLRSLSAPEYRAPAGENGGFLLKHSVGGFPSHAEVDVALTYADYYYVEAMMRYKDLMKEGSRKRKFNSQSNRVVFP
jgi:unsaturated chondroitin disaccharide hydrolase